MPTAKWPKTTLPLLMGRSEKAFQVVFGVLEPQIHHLNFSGPKMAFQAPKTLRFKGKMANFDAKKITVKQGKKAKRTNGTHFARVLSPPHENPPLETPELSCANLRDFFGDFVSRVSSSFESFVQQKGDVHHLGHWKLSRLLAPAHPRGGTPTNYESEPLKNTTTQTKQIAQTLFRSVCGICRPQSF